MQISKGDFATYTSLGAVAAIEAINETLRLEPAMAARLPDFFTSPIWHFVPAALLILVAGLWIFRYFGWFSRTSTRLYSQTFAGTRVILDYHEYFDCTFTDCIFVFDGGPHLLMNCHIIGMRRFETNNPVLTNTINILKILNFLDANFAASWRQQPIRKKMMMTLAASNLRSENVRILAIVVAELKFRDVQRHIFGADLVEAPHDPAFEDGPETFNHVRVDRADNILMNAVVNGAVRIPIRSQIVIDAALIRREQTNLVRNGFSNECLGGLFGDVLQDASNNVALAADRTNDGRLTTHASNDAASTTMFVDALTADVGFVHLDNAAKLSLRPN